MLEICGIHVPDLLPSYSRGSLFSYVMLFFFFLIKINFMDE